MSVAAQKLTRDAFREMYAQRKPYFELLDGAAVQKSLPTRLHSILQFVLSVMLKSLSIKSRPELTLAIDESWEPTPDVCGVPGPGRQVHSRHSEMPAVCGMGHPGHPRI